MSTAAFPHNNRQLVSLDADSYHCYMTAFDIALGTAGDLLVLIQPDEEEGGSESSQDATKGSVPAVQTA